MLNPYKNSGLASDDATADDNDLSALGFHEADENEEDLEEELEDATANSVADEDAADFDLDENVENEVSAPVFGAPAGNSPATFFKAEEDEATPFDDGEKSAFAETTADEEDEDAELEPALARALEGAVEESAFAKATADEEELMEEAVEDEDVGEDSVIVSKSKIVLAKKLLENIQENSERLLTLFGGLIDDGDEERISLAEISESFDDTQEEESGVIEGIFDGENMIGPDGKEYSVPANYASKSKLVEGDMLKLTITDRGTFIYKQTKPIERKRIIGKLEKDANGGYLVVADKKKFRVITASITYYKGIPGDKVVILVPVAGDSSWAAVENVIKSK